jgi:hypothetical protein
MDPDLRNEELLDGHLRPREADGLLVAISAVLPRHKL